MVPLLLAILHGIKTIGGERLCNAKGFPLATPPTALKFGLGNLTFSKGKLETFKVRMSANEKHSGGGGGGKSKIAKNMGKGCAKKFVERGKSMVCKEKNLADDVDSIESNKEVHAKKKRRKETLIILLKRFPTIHQFILLIPMENYRPKRVIKKETNKQIKKKKGIKKEHHYSEQYHDLMLDNLLKQYYSTKSPHLIISHKWFYKIRKNAIMLKSVQEKHVEKNRYIYYDIERFGDNVRYTKKNNHYVLNPSSTHNNTIYITVRLHDLSCIDKIQFHTELGYAIQKLDVKHEKARCYAILSVIKMDKKVLKMKPIITQSDLPLMKRFYVNQIALRKGNYHFNTTGTIYGLGYGPKSNRNEYGHSVCKYANRKFH